MADIERPSGEARARLRSEHGVRLVSANEEGTAAERLPAGVYGFTSTPALASPLFSERKYRNFEVHHGADGTVTVIGFATPAHADLIRAGREIVSIELFPDIEGDATEIVAISYDRIAHHRQYSVRNAAAVQLHVKPNFAAV